MILALSPNAGWCGASLFNGPNPHLPPDSNHAIWVQMKFLLAVLAYLLIAAVLGWGILLAFKGSPWLLIVSFLAYAVVFAKAGCLPGKSH